MCFLIINLFYITFKRFPLGHYKEVNIITDMMFSDCKVFGVVVWLFLTVPGVCLQFVIVVFSDHTHLLLLSILLVT